MKPILSVIYIYYNTPKEILHSISSLEESIKKIRYEIIIVDNNSPVQIPHGLSSNRKIRIIKNKKNNGFGKAINQAAKIAGGQFFLIINPDTVLFPDAVKKLHRRLKNDVSIGVVSPKILNIDGNLLDSISRPPYLPAALVVFSPLKKTWPFSLLEKKYHLRDLDRDREHVVPIVSGACMFMRREVFRRVNGFDERFFMYFEEADFCIRVGSLGLKNLYFPGAKITHFVGRSSSDKALIKSIFETSRFRFFQKYHGNIPAFLGEVFLRFFTLENATSLALILLSSYLLFYKLSELMMFFGDFGRDYLAARDAVLQGQIPLVGITSSVTWLHQGPLSIWFIALSFLIAKFYPHAPAYLYAFFGVVTTMLLFRIGSVMFDKVTGFMAALFFTTSPLILVNVRIPYHTAPIPLFAIVFLFFLWRFLTERKYIFWLGFFLGLLLLLELSNAVLFFVLAAMYLLYRPKLVNRDIAKGICGVLIGVLPFLLYDLTNRFAQTIGFSLWIINRIRLFFGFTLSGASTTASFPSALVTIWDQIRRLVYPQDAVIVFVVLVAVLLAFFSKNTKMDVKMGLAAHICMIWSAGSLLGYAVHAAPGTAYFPLLFVPLVFLIGYSFSVLGRKWKPIYLFFALLVWSNVLYTLKNQYFLDTTAFFGSKAIGWEYGLGEAFSERQKVVKFMINDANGEPMQINAGGFLRMFESSIDNYKYLVWYEGGRESKSAKVVYTIYQNKAEIPKNKIVVYTNSFAYVTKN